MPFEGEVLGEVRSSRRLARTAFEVDDRNHMKLIAVRPAREIAPLARTPVGIQVSTKLEHLFCGIRPAARGRSLWLWAFALEVQFFDGRLRYAEEIGDFRQRKLTQPFLSIGWILLLTQYIEAIRDQLSLLENDLVEGNTPAVTLEWS